MKLTKTLAMAMSLTMVAAALVGCGGEETKSEETTTTTTTTTTAAETTTAAAVTTTAAPVVDANPVVAEDGEAYLALQDGQVWIQYWGNDEHPLCYDAGVAKITGNGSYTVSVDATTAAFHQDTETGDDYKCSGIQFMAILINEGTTLYGTDMVMTIDSILVDGKEIDMVAKNYTSSDDGKERRTNIYNGYMAADKLSEDAICADGPLFVDGAFTDAASEFSPHIINTDDFASWSTIEVNFTVSGMDKDKEEDGSAAGSEDTESAEGGEASAESTAE
ncbi:MAG: hypothetical protein E7501_02920 [Ruminococcus sp.]|nr:hypothetical protein [Ruminococcus sp.]